MPVETACCLQLVSSSVVWAHLESDWIWGSFKCDVYLVIGEVCHRLYGTHLREGKCPSRDTFFVIFALVMLLFEK